jgi:predicted nucleic acid-binding protein
MIVYVESNFILELAYLQEEHVSCEALLSLAAGKNIFLALPAFSVTEARVSLTGRVERRRKFYDQLKRELREFSRSAPYRNLAQSATSLTRALLDSADQEKKRLDVLLGRVLQTCHVIPIQARTASRGMEFEEMHRLSPKDAVILAAVLEDLAERSAGPKCFLNRNSRDFANPDIEDELRKHDCRLISSFKDGLGFVQRNVRRRSGSRSSGPSRTKRIK